MIIQAFPSGPFETNAYVVACPQTRHAAIIDPAPDSSDALLSYITENQLIPEKILLTHSHWDHIADAALLKEHYKIPVYVHPLDAPNLERPGSDKLPCWMEIEGVRPDGWLNDKDKITLGNLSFEVIHTPGHTPGSICLYCPDKSLLVSGDTLFKGTIGNISFPTSRPNLMWGSLEKLSKLPPVTSVFPGHGPSTTIGEEKWLANAKQIFGNSF